MQSDHRFATPAAAAAVSERNARQHDALRFVCIRLLVVRETARERERERKRECENISSLACLLQQLLQHFARLALPASTTMTVPDVRNCCPKIDKQAAWEAGECKRLSKCSRCGGEARFLEQGIPLCSSRCRRRPPSGASLARTHCHPLN